MPRKIIVYLCYMAFVYATLGCLKVEKKMDLKENVDLVQNESIQTELIIDKEWNLKNNEAIKVDRIILKDKARILTNQYHLRIEAKEFISERGAVIESFSVNNKAAENAKGLDGGTVDIKTFLAIGNLQVKMNGQDGGNGSSGWDGKSSTTFLPSTAACYPLGGADGGKTGSFFFESMDSTGFSLSTSMTKSKPGKDGAVALGTGLLSKRDRKTCRLLPISGQAGQEGQICIKMSSSVLSVCK